MAAYGSLAAASSALRTMAANLLFEDTGRRKTTMLWYAWVFLVIAIIAAIFGFGGIAAASAGIAKICFIIFLVLFLVSLFAGRRRVI
jgi:uncharacterized membrane protein YtjA (UPF0391 family)